MSETWILTCLILVLGVSVSCAQSLDATYAKLQSAKPEVIVSALECADSATRELALAQIARENRSPALTRAAVDAVATVKQPGVKAQLIAVLAERGDASAAPAVRKALGDADPLVRAAAIEACGLLKDAKASEALLGMLGGAQDEAAREALRRIPDTGIDAALVKRLRKGVGPERAQALELLVARRYAGALKLAMDKSLFASGDAALAKAAAGAIRAYAPVDGFDALLVFALSLPPASAELLAGTLAALIDAAPERAKAERAVEKQLAVCEASHAPMLTALLAGSQGADALRVLAKRLESVDAEVRKDAVRSLGKWNSEAALVPLVLAARREQEAGAQTLAWRAVLDIVKRSDKIVDFYQPVSAIQQTIWFAPRREEKIAALEALPLYHPKAWEVEWLLTKVESEKPDLAEEAGRIKDALVPPFSGLLGR